ncbi:MAG: transposase [Prolixibacteraceae bacterium]|jgi:transposase|nr:transposase [Prolixibacteraceae bacterium]
MLKQKKVVLRQLRKQLTALNNLKESFSVLPVIDKQSISAINKSITFLKKQIGVIEEELIRLSRDEFEKQVSLLTSIRGIGITLATSLIIATGGFTQFDNAKQLSRYIGICPTYQQSGSSVKIKGHINRNGDSDLRALLYMATWSACKECYERLKSNGKPSKVASQ